MRLIAASGMRSPVWNWTALTAQSRTPLRRLLGEPRERRLLVVEECVGVEAHDLEPVELGHGLPGQHVGRELSVEDEDAIAARPWKAGRDLGDSPGRVRGERDPVGRRADQPGELAPEALALGHPPHERARAVLAVVGEHVGDRLANEDRGRRDARVVRVDEWHETAEEVAVAQHGLELTRRCVELRRLDVHSCSTCGPRTPSSTKRVFGKGLGAGLELPLAFEQDDGLPVHVERAVAVEQRLELRDRRQLALDPACHREAHALEPHVGTVLGDEPVANDLELQLADGADDRLAFAPLRRLEELDRPLLRELLEALLELLALHRIDHRDTREVLRRKLREGLVGEVHAARDGVADAEDARVEDADDVAREAVVDDRALLRHELRRVREADLAIEPHVPELHAAGRTCRCRRAGRPCDRGARGPCSPGS
jgi:hypothetical protein